MSKAVVAVQRLAAHKKKTSQGRNNLSTSMMNKSKRRSHKKYRGQGR